MYPPSNDMADVSALAAGGSCEHRATDRSLRSAQVERDVEDGGITITADGLRCSFGGCIRADVSAGREGGVSGS